MLEHIKRVKDYVSTTSISTLREHLITALDITISEKAEDDEDAKKGKPGGSGLKQMKLSFKQKLPNFEPCSNKFELGRDLTVWAALDLEPFIFTGKTGTRFFEKNLPSIPLSLRDTLARTAYDVYGSGASSIKAELALIGGGAVCVMFDGWSYKYRHYPYIGLRLAFISENWK